ncbi:nucleotide-binding universal stress UspA family protein [Collimonas sp. PA-H2]|jgi:nucleotide-binding universal stress UspA family protein|uniref:universal stress protein n=1 Tax=Collimonas TaxID=202907 RepID=UPI000BF3DB56|nr:MULTISPECIES: universal stress protein [Collimonas]PFH07795.1 nucleotide-binding universal stress UspA family protein [Collimonas sp. PA-H2]
MYKHLLLPIDGSPLSEIAIQNTMRFAKSINAKVTGFYVSPPYHALSLQMEMLAETEDDFAKHSRVQAERLLGTIEDAASVAGVSCNTTYAIGAHPYEEIIKAANDNGCDLITMASHGRKGVKGLLLGSEAQKVLTHSKIPVLVYR